MNPIALIGGAAAAGFGLYKVVTKKPTSKDFQTQNVVSQSGIPVKVVTPIPKATTVSQRTGVSQTRPVTSHAAAPQQAAGTTLYAPPKAVTQTGPGKFELAPIIVTPTGAASVAIGSITDIQRALNCLGFSPKLTEDGKLGPKTSANIRAFQSKAGIAIDGNAGPATKAALSNALVGMANGTPMPTAPAKASAVRPVAQKPVYSTQTQTELGPYDTAPNRAGLNATVSSARDVQHALNMLGTKPALIEDGNIGPKSVAAIKSFQMTHGLAADGVAGAKTKQALAAAVSAPVHGDYDMSGEDAVALSRGTFNPGSWC